MTQRTQPNRRTSTGVPHGISEEVVRTSPTQPPVGASAPSLTATISFVSALLTTASVVAWLAAPFIA